MRALDILLRAEDDRHGLVHRVLAQHQHRFLFAADRPGRPALEVNRAAENLLRRVIQRAGRVDFALRLFPPVVDDNVHVQRLILPRQIADIRRKRRVLAVQPDARLRIHIAVTQRHLPQHNPPAAVAVPDDFIIHQRVFARRDQLNQFHFRAVLGGQLRLHMQLACRAKGLEERLFRALFRLNGHALAGIRRVRRNQHIRLFCGFFRQHDRRAFVPVNRCFIHAQTIPRPAGQLIDGHFLH